MWLCKLLNRLKNFNKNQSPTYYGQLRDALEKPLPIDEIEAPEFVFGSVPETWIRCQRKGCPLIIINPVPNQKYCRGKNKCNKIVQKQQTYDRYHRNKS